jgi:hypothetical protein
MIFMKTAGSGPPFDFPALYFQACRSANASLAPSAAKPRRSQVVAPGRVTTRSGTRAANRPWSLKNMQPAVSLIAKAGLPYKGGRVTSSTRSDTK